DVATQNAIGGRPAGTGRAGVDDDVRLGRIADLGARHAVRGEDGVPDVDRGPDAGRLVGRVEPRQPFTRRGEPPYRRASNGEVTSRVRRSIRPKRARMPAVLTLWEAPSYESSDDRILTPRLPHCRRIPSVSTLDDW